MNEDQMYDAAERAMDLYRGEITRITAERDQARAERDKLREELDEIGVMAANAPEDGDSFGLLEEIAMRIGTDGMPL